MILHADVGLHPAVDVTAHGDHHLGGPEGAGGVHLHGLVDVEALVQLGRGVDVVHEAVAVGDADLLTRLHAQDMRVVPAPLLVQRHALAGGGELEARIEPLAHVDEDVAQATVAHHRHGPGRGLVVLVHAVGLALHGQLLGRRRRALEVDDAGHVAGLGLGHGVLHLPGGLASGLGASRVPFSAAAHGQQARQGRGHDSTHCSQVLHGTHSSSEVRLDCPLSVVPAASCRAAADRCSLFWARLTTTMPSPTVINMASSGATNTVAGVSPWR